MHLPFKLLAVLVLGLLRSHALGSFRDLLLDITHDPAMLIWLNGIDNTKYDPNENYAREVMELFTLGADRGAYTEQDVRNLARAFTGWRASWVDGPGNIYVAGHVEGGFFTRNAAQPLYGGATDNGLAKFVIL